MAAMDALAAPAAPDDVTLDVSDLIQVYRDLPPPDVAGARLARLVAKLKRGRRGRRQKGR